MVLEFLSPIKWRGEDGLVGTQQNSTDFAMIHLTVIPAQLTPRQMWMREGPKCKAIIEKERSSDAWKCFWCGWDKKCRRRIGRDAAMEKQ